MRHFGDRMDVLDRTCKGDSANSTAASLDHRSVLPTTWQDSPLARNFPGSRDPFNLLQKIEICDHGRVHDVKTDAVARNGDSVLWRNAGRFAAECCVTCHTNVCVCSEGCRLGTSKTDLLLNGPCCDKIAGMMFQHFNRANLCPATNAVVEALRNDAIANVTEGTAQHDHVADLYLLFDFVRGTSHVNEELADVRYLFFSSSVAI